MAHSLFALLFIRLPKIPFDWIKQSTTKQKELLSFVKQLLQSIIVISFGFPSFSPNDSCCFFCCHFLEILICSALLLPYVYGAVAISWCFSVTDGILSERRRKKFLWNVTFKDQNLFTCCRRLPLIEIWFFYGILIIDLDEEKSRNIPRNDFGIMSVCVFFQIRTIRMAFINFMWKSCVCHFKKWPSYLWQSFSVQMFAAICFNLLNWLLEWINLFFYIEHEKNTFFQPHRNRFIMLPSLEQWNMRISKTNAIKIALFLPDFFVFRKKISLKEKKQQDE